MLPIDTVRSLNNDRRSICHIKGENLQFSKYSTRIFMYGYLYSHHNKSYPHAHCVTWQIAPTFCIFDKYCQSTYVYGLRSDDLLISCDKQMLSSPLNWASGESMLLFTIQDIHILIVALDCLSSSGLNLYTTGNCSALF